MRRFILGVVALVALMPVVAACSKQMSPQEFAVQDTAKQHVVDLVTARGYFLPDGKGDVGFHDNSLTRGNMAFDFTHPPKTGTRFGFAEFEVVNNDSIRIGCLDANGYLVDFLDDPVMANNFTIPGHCPVPMSPRARRRTPLGVQRRARTN